MNFMKIHFITYIQFVMLCTLISSIEINVKELSNLDDVINNHDNNDPDPDHDDDPDHDHDVMNNGINDIIKVLETVNNLSIQEYTSMNDHVSNKENTMELIRYPRSISLNSTTDFNTEYQNIPCYFQCILRSNKNNQEIRKISKTIFHVSHQKIAILDCLNSSVTTTVTTTTTTTTATMNSTSTSSIINNPWNQSIMSQCVTHFTKRLLHIIIGTLSNHFNMEWFIITSNQFSSSIYHSIQNYIQPTTDLYLTLTIPIYRLDRDDFNLFSTWLRYISIDGKQLRYIDVMLIANLSLDYFILQDCIRNDEIIINPLVTTLPDSRIELYNDYYTNCLIYWIYTCPNYSQFIIIADRKTHKHYCKTMVNPMESSTMKLSTKQLMIKKLRAKRSLKKYDPSKLSMIPGSYERTTTSPPPPPTTTTTATTISSLTKSSTETWHSNQSKMIDHSNISTIMNHQTLLSTVKDCILLEDYIKQYINDKCEQKITWLLNMLTILLIILLIMIIIIFGLLLIFSYFIKQYLLLQHETKIR
ncbi:hypothetical protein MS3_00007115 [Schistosoma haematobium]|uniref:Uncharacterized protein n=2 Tax=Schistosoma haematobium TaxID=6185 RepID=A0A922ISY9_SCHHA|nr:hypothetical protein MS3_00007115 [Schistosoma haematobium]KAH9586063.1 hypothetical protein MS3_00007115 [Schistosoma haematobium]